MDKKITIAGQPSVVIAHCDTKNKLLMAVYDAGYKQVSYRFSANNIGGNPDCEKHPTDTSPNNVLVREVGEEYNSHHRGMTKFGETVLWAPKEDIELIKDELINGARPYQDFLVRAVQLPNDPTTRNYTAIYSGFESEVSVSVIEAIESNLRRCRRLSTEGLTGVFTLDELANDPLKGNLSTAHATAPMINRLLGCRIPYPSQLTAEAIGQVRASFREYLVDFAYAEGIVKAIGLKK